MIFNSNLPSLVTSLILIDAYVTSIRFLVSLNTISSFKPFPSLVFLELRGSSTMTLKVLTKGLAYESSSVI